jgi:DNA-binding Xre family transcriptional regulator
MITCHLATLLRERRLSQTRFAQLVGIHRNTLRKLYANTWTAIRRDTLDRICSVLHVSVDELLVWRDERRRHPPTPNTRR